MPAHRLSSDERQALATNDLVGTDPGDGGTVDIGNKNNMMFICEVSGAETRVLPTEADTPLGTRILFFNTGDNTLTVDDANGDDICVIAKDAEAGECLLAQTAAGKEWVGQIYLENAGA